MFNRIFHIPVYVVIADGDYYEGEPVMVGYSFSKEEAKKIAREKAAGKFKANVPLYDEATETYRVGNETWYVEEKTLEAK